MASDGEGSSTPIWPLLWTVFASILEVFILCFAGWVLAYKGIIDKKTQKQLNRINVSLFTPSLLFSKVAFALSPQKLKELWIIPIFFVVVTGVSAFVAWSLGHLFRLKRTQRNFAMAAAMFNNSNSLPIALMQSLVITVTGLKWGTDDNKDAMLGRALSYLVLYSTLGMMLRWSFGVHLLSQADDEVVAAKEANAHIEDLNDDEPSTRVGSTAQIRNRHVRNKLSVAFSVPPNEQDDAQQLSPEQIANLSHVSSTSSLERGMPPPPHTITAPPPLVSRPSVGTRKPSFFYSFPNTPTRSAAELGTPPMEEDLRSETGADDEWGGQGSLPHPHGVTPPSSSRWGSFRRKTWSRTKKVWKGIEEFMTIPMWAALASLIVACVRPFQHALDVHMQPVKGALVAAGNCSIPVTLVVLGAYFYNPPSPPEVNGEGETQGLLLHVPEESRDRRSRQWSSSEMSIGTLTDGIREAFKMASTKTKRDVHLANGQSQGHPKEDPATKGEATTVFVSVVSRMILSPALVLPAVAALAIFETHSVTDDPVFVVSMVLLVSSPPALTLAQITQAASGDSFERLISKTIFWSYCVFTPPLTIAYVMIGLLMSKL